MEKRGFKKFWIIITTAFLLVGLFLTAWFTTLEVTEKDALKKYNQQQLLLVEGTAVGINGMLTDLSVSLGSLGLLPEIQYFDETPARTELARKLDELISQGITDIGILNADGVAIAFAIETESEGVDHSWRAYFRNLQKSVASGNSDPIILELHNFYSGEPGLKIAIPVFETAVNADHPDPSGEFAGAIVGDLKFDTLIQRYINPFKPPGDGHIFLVSAEYDIIWSSKTDMIQTSILGNRQDAFAQMADQMGMWTLDASRGSFYEYETSSDGNNLVLIAFAPVDVGQGLLAIGVMTPDEVIWQTSLTNFQSQQLVFIISVFVILVGVMVGGFVLSREITRRFQVEDALKEREMEQVLIAERNRLAGDLHDSVTQGLYGILLHADAAQKQLSTGRNNRATDYLKEIKTAGKDALLEMRLLIFELRPPVLESEGLATALKTRLHAVEKRAGLETEFHSSLDAELPSEVQDGLYRIAQEVLNNITKHAHAQRISVYLYQDEKVVTLEIVDDGCGFDLEAAQSSGGMGLSNISARTLKIGGLLTIESQPNEGTRVLVEVAI